MKQSLYNSERHTGEQPIRVLRNNLDKWFQETYPNFKEDVLDEAINKMGLHNEINVVDRLEKVQVPAGVGTFKIITVQETYLSYLWGLCYSLIFIYDKQIHQPKIDATYVITSELSDQIKKAHDLFNYSLSLIEKYNSWDKDDLPNPEFCAPSDEYIFKANGVYLHAINYVLLHELGHVALGHIDKDIENEEKGIKTSPEDILKGEYEADEYSIHKSLQGGTHLTNDRTIAAGIVAGICSFIFFDSSMKGGDHPDPDERLQKAFDSLNLEPEDNLYGIACLALKLWSLQFKIDLKWPEIVDTYKELFDITMERLSEHKTENAEQ
ncbi:phage exclusion protein Lit family protein [Cyclobacterium xiamenense]|uniref:phage exclusion protein Lit family protein n=1 Tax=Cyclobacterium xiamenense TaxID=1297121 RepID=UPI0012B934A3|nr:phage exclusion protein Lit family protein [Cyclobacterium xiamenense]